MKLCAYCGQRNEDALAFCAGCGKPFTAPDEVQGAMRPRVGRQGATGLNAGSATIVLAIYVGTQFVFGAACALLGVGGTRGQDAAITVLTVVLAGVAMLTASLAFLRTHLRDVTHSGAAWVPGRWTAVAKGFIVGLLVAACVHAVSWLLRSHVAYKDLGPLARMATTPGTPQAMWLVGGLVVAPFVEELLFRGILYGGYRKSFGPIWAALAATLMFVVMHLDEARRSHSAMAGLACLAASALWLRLQSRAIGPAVAAHFGYNALLAFFVVHRTAL